MNDLRRRMDLYCSSCTCGRNASNRKDTCGVEQQQIRNDIEVRAAEFELYGKAFLAGFKAVVDEFAKIEGTRSLILVSDGFAFMPGRELYATASAYPPNSS